MINTIVSPKLQNLVAEKQALAEAANQALHAAEEEQIAALHQCQDLARRSATLRLQAGALRAESSVDLAAVAVQVADHVLDNDRSRLVAAMQHAVTM